MLAFYYFFICCSGSLKAVPKYMSSFNAFNANPAFSENVQSD